MRIRAYAVAIASFGGRWLTASRKDICASTQSAANAGGMHRRL